MDFLNEINDLSKQELIDLMLSYNDYVMNFHDEHDEGCELVCISEFYYNDYQEV